MKKNQPTKGHNGINQCKNTGKMSDEVRNLLATAIVDNSTKTKCLQPYVHIEESEFEDDRDDRDRKSFGQFQIEKLQWLNDGDSMCRPAGIMQSQAYGKQHS